MKVLFLDIDGVLNDPEFIDNLDWDWHMSREERDLSMICEKRVTLLNQLIPHFDHMVLSSDWRLTNGAEEVGEYLKEKGFAGTLHELATPDLYHRDCAHYRGNEVDAWLKEHAPGADYLCLDDSRLFREDQNVFYTDPNKGLTQEDVDAIVRIQ